MPFARGTTATLYQSFVDANDDPINPPDPRVDIINPSNVTVVTDAIPVNDSLGHYHYDYAIAIDAPLGTWTQHVTGIIDGQLVSADEMFEVVAVGAPVVQQSDVEVMLGRVLTVTEAGRVQRLLSMAEAQIEAVLPGFSVSTATATAEVIPYNDPDVMWTARYPVTAVTSLLVDGSVFPSTSYRWNEKGRIEFGTWSSTGDFELNLTGLTRWSEVSITYPYGITPLPADLASLIAAAVAATLRRQAANPSGVQSESLGAYEVRYGDFSAREAASGLVTIDPTARALRRWTRTRQLSVPFARQR